MLARYQKQPQLISNKNNDRQTDKQTDRKITTSDKLIIKMHMHRNILFYRATRMHNADYAVAKCLSVRLSHAGIESRQI